MKTADEIRGLFSVPSDVRQNVLAEIAAQLQEHNDIQREILQLQREARAKQDKIENEMLAALGQQAADRANAVRTGAIASERTRRH